MKGQDPLKIFYLEKVWKVIYPEPTCSILRSPVEGILFLEEQWMVFYLEKASGRYSTLRRPVEGIITLEYLWKVEGMLF